MNDVWRFFGHSGGLKLASIGKVITKFFSHRTKTAHMVVATRIKHSLGDEESLQP